MKRKNGALKKVNKINKLFAGLITKKRKKTHIAKIMKGTVGITTELTGGKKDDKKILANKINKLNKFLKKQKSTKTDSKGSTISEWTITSKKFGLVINNSPKRKAQTYMASLVNHTKPLKKNKYQFFTKSSKNIEEE